MEALGTVEIDPNVRTSDNHTYSSLNDLRGVASVGSDVRVIEPESGLNGIGTVVQIDTHRDIIYLQVEWTTLSIDESLVDGVSEVASPFQSPWNATPGLIEDLRGGWSELALHTFNVVSASTVRGSKSPNAIEKVLANS